MDVTEFKPTQHTSHDAIRLFLAGSIEQGTAEKWHNRVIDRLRSEEGPNKILAFNPRRDEWDATLDQSPENEVFSGQVNWELFHIETADVIFFWFDGATKSPITLLELGLVLGDITSNEKYVIVYCPKDYWRYGNVAITAERSGVEVHTNPEEAIQNLVRLLKRPHRRFLVD